MNLLKEVQLTTVIQGCPGASGAVHLVGSQVLGHLPVLTLEIRYHRCQSGVVPTWQCKQKRLVDIPSVLGTGA